MLLFQTDEGRILFEIPSVTKSGENTCRITKKISKSYQYQTMKKLTQASFSCKDE